MRFDGDMMRFDAVAVLAASMSGDGDVGDVVFFVVVVVSGGPVRIGMLEWFGRRSPICDTAVSINER